MELMTLMTLPTSEEDSPSLATVAVVASTVATARAATPAASLAFWAISRIEVDICSVPVATVCTLNDTVSAAADTRPAWEEDWDAEALIRLETEERSSDAAVSDWAFV